MTVIRIEYDKAKCVGNGICVKKDPSLFSLEGGKAVLKNARVEGSLECWEEKCDTRQVHDIVAAARSCPVNAIRVADMDSNLELVGVNVDISKAKELMGSYTDADFVLDPSGYFLIRINEQKRLLEVAFCTDKNKVEVVISGKKPVDVYHTISKLHLVTRPEHMAYLGKELQKAYIAAQLKKKYVQDDELEF